MTEREALILGILAAPLADLPRLVFADWLDENGDPEQAAFIRDQINPEAAATLTKAIFPEMVHIDPERDFHKSERDTFVHGPREQFVFSRGSIVFANLPADWLFDRTCERCKGNGSYSIWAGSGPENTKSVECVYCHGKGRPHGFLKAIAERHPIERVHINSLYTLRNSIGEFIIGANLLPEEIYGLLRPSWQEGYPATVYNGAPADLFPGWATSGDRDRAVSNAVTHWLYPALRPIIDRDLEVSPDIQSAETSTSTLDGVRPRDASEAVHE